MYGEHQNDDTSGFINDSNLQNQNEMTLDYKREDMMSNASDNLFRSDEDLMIKEEEIEGKTRLKYFGIYSDSQFTSIINLTTSAIGGGCLNYCYILSSIGLPMTLIIFIFVSISVYYTLDLLRSFVVDTKYFSFALITNETLGKTWLKIYAICSLIFYLSIEINYLSIVYNIISKMINSSGGKEILFNFAYFFITIFFELCICMYISKIKKIHIFSLISSVLFIITLLIVFIQGIYNMIANPGDKFKYDVLIKPKIKNKWEYFLEMMSYMIEFLYGYSYHSSYPTLLSNFKEVDEINTKHIHNISFFFIFISYLLIAIFGYFLKFSMFDMLLINNNNKTIELTGTLIGIFRIILCLFTSSVFPLRFIVIRDNYTSLLVKQNNKRLPFTADLIAAFVCLIFCNLIVFLMNNSIIAFNISLNCIHIFGGIFGVIIGFFLPVVNYVGANGKRKVKSIIGYILTGIFSIIGVFSVCHSIYGLFIQNNYDNQ